MNIHGAELLAIKTTVYFLKQLNLNISNYILIYDDMNDAKFEL